MAGHKSGVVAAEYDPEDHPRSHRHESAGSKDKTFLEKAIDAWERYEVPNAEKPYSRPVQERYPHAKPDVKHPVERANEELRHWAAEHPDAARATFGAGVNYFLGGIDPFGGKGAEFIGGKVFDHWLEGGLSTATAPGAPHHRPRTTPAKEKKKEREFLAALPEMGPMPGYTVTETNKPKNQEERLLQALVKLRGRGGPIKSRTYHRAGHRKAGRPKGSKDKLPRKRRSAKK